MNELIKKLEDQCWVQVPCDFDMDKGGLSTIRTVFDRTKFAELIVGECAKIGYMYGGLRVQLAIQEKFGVEE